MSEPAAERTERDEQQESRQHPEIEGADPGSCIAESAGREGTRDTGDINRGPRNTSVARRQIGHEIAGKCQRAPHDHQQAGELVDRRLTDPMGHRFDIRQCGGGLLGIDARHELTPVVATSSAITDMAAGSWTMPMWSTPSMILMAARSPTVSPNFPESISSSAEPENTVT